jgi:hypothetical protein
MENTYWNDKGKYQSDYANLWELVPSSGKCDTLAGEMIRAATRLCYDFYNNGMGNNTSGAIRFLESKCVFSNNLDIFQTIYEYTRGRLYHGGYNGDQLQLAIEKMIDLTIEKIKELDAESISNEEDMFDYEEPEQPFCEECGSEIDEGSSFMYGHICPDCERMYDDDDDDEYDD